MLLSRETSQLVVVDMQERLVPALHDSDALTSTVARLLAAARLLDLPVLATEHMAERIGGTIDALEFSEDEIFDKASFSAVRQTGFLDQIKRRQVVICGAEAHVCVMQTALDLHAQGFAVVVAEDAVGSRYPVDRTAALSRMQASGLVRATVEMVLFEWLGRGDVAEFPHMLQLVKERP